MSTSKGTAAPESGPAPSPEPTAAPAIPTFEELTADPEIAALLDFEPAPVRKRVNGWDSDAQRAFVAALAVTGSKQRAAEALCRNASAIERLMNRAEGASLKAAAERAMALAEQRSGAFLVKGVQAAGRFAHSEPFPSRRGRRNPEEPAPLLPGQLYNELGEPEDQDSYDRRVDDAHESIREKLLRCRRLFLKEISHCPGKRAAFELITELPIDWEKAEALEPQPDEPWKSHNARQPDMVMTAESGWLYGEHGYGPDKKGELRAAFDAWRAAEGLAPIDWSESAED